MYAHAGWLGRTYFLPGASLGRVSRVQPHKATVRDVCFVEGAVFGISSKWAVASISESKTIHVRHFSSFMNYLFSLIQLITCVVCVVCVCVCVCVCVVLSCVFVWVFVYV